MVFQAAREIGNRGRGAARDGFEDIAGGGESGFDAGVIGMHRAGNYAADSGDQVWLFTDCDNAGGRSDHVDYIAFPHARADGVPVRIERAHRYRNACAQPQLPGPLRRKMARNLVRRGIAPIQLGAHARQQRIHFHQEFLGRQAAQFQVPHPLVAHRADTARRLARIRDAAQHRGHHVAMFERGDHRRALVRIGAQPVQQLREPPFRRVHAPAPFERFQFLRAAGRGDLGGLAFGAMVAP